MKLSTGDLLARRRGLVERLGDVEQVLLGSVVEQTRRCGKVACHCAAAKPHGPYTYLTTRRGRRGMRYVPSVLIPVVTAYLRRGEHVEAVLAEISAINVELLARRELSEQHGVSSGITAIATTHDRALIDLADRVVIMENGQIQPVPNDSSGPKL